MFNKIPTVLKSQEIINKAFSKAAKIEEPYHPDIADKIRKELIDKISTIEGVACSHFDRLVKKFPSTEKLHPFYYGLLDLMFDVDKYKLSLGKIQWTSERITILSTDYIRRLKNQRDRSLMNPIMKEYYGRFSSLIKNISGDLEFLSQCRDYMRKVPEIETDLDTFIIAGMPNVGKSSLLGVLTTSKPTVAPYPFTTQSIHIGYTDIGYYRVQIIDTPGILDRQMSERNEMERKAILALQKIDSCIIFLIDYSGSSGYSVEQQENLYGEIARMFRKKIIRVQSKVDISQERRENICISIDDRSGIKDLLSEMEIVLRDSVNVAR
ncbi:MAG: NOG1 family protein [Thermoplasmataceae archaeon]